MAPGPHVLDDLMAFDRGEASWPMSLRKWRRVTDLARQADLLLARGADLAHLREARAPGRRCARWAAPRGVLGDLGTGADLALLLDVRLVEDVDPQLLQQRQHLIDVLDVAGEDLVHLLVGDVAAGAALLDEQAHARVHLVDGGGQGAGIGFGAHELGTSWVREGRQQAVRSELVTSAAPASRPSHGRRAP
jgi:hypothetical protein